MSFSNASHRAAGNRSPHSRSPLAAGRLSTALLTVALATVSLQAANLYLPNASFESPETAYADPAIDAWQKEPQPAWYNVPEFPWHQLTGQFLNTPPDDPRYIVNLNGSQALFLFAVPQVGLFQDYLSLGGTNATPTHEFDARFHPGKAYALTLGVIGGGGNMLEGATLQASLYYRDDAGAQVTVAALNITNSPTLFSNTTHFVDFTLRLLPVKPTDLWAGRHIGVQLLSTVAPELNGGYWDVDNLRLTEVIEVPNGSFESPDIIYADPTMDAWQKSPKPDWYEEAGGFTWDQLAGLFDNTLPEDPRYIDNLHGSQALFLFAVPGVAVFQDYQTVAGTNDAPTHDLDVRFTPGMAYHLTFSVIGGGGNMAEGATLEASLYYRDSSGNPVTVGSTTITHTPLTFSNTTRFVDFSFTTPVVQPADPAAAQHIGIQFRSTVAPELAGGFWDLDHVRLVELTAPRFTRVTPGAGQTQLTLTGEPGRQFEILAAQDATEPLSAWTRLGSVTNLTGTADFHDDAAPIGGRFYHARQLP